MSTPNLRYKAEAVTVAQAADILSVSEKTIRRLIALQELNAFSARYAFPSSKSRSCSKAKTEGQEWTGMDTFAQNQPPLPQGLLSPFKFPHQVCPARTR